MHRRRRFWPWLAVWTVVGTGIRIGTIAGRPNRQAGGDPFFYYNGARLLVEGHGFIDPFNYLWFHHQVVPSAAYAPGFMVLLTVPVILGLKSFFAARIWSALLSAAAIVVGGLAGREIGGRRVGLVTAFLFALLPNMWMSAEQVAAETIEPLVVAAVLLCTYRFWRQPTMARVVWLGVVLGLTMLCRDELALLLLLILVPVCLLARTLSWPRRMAVLGAGLVASLAVIAPWVGYNMARFEKPTFISDGEGITLSSANCATTFSGPLEGYWSMGCALNDAKSIPKGEDESAQGAHFQHDALTFISHHENRLVPVALAKLGRAFGFFHPLQQIDLDTLIETRPHNWALVGLGAYYALLPLSIAGTVLLRRARIPVYPLWAVGVNVVLAVIVAFGNTRYRLPFEVCLVIMSSVTVAWAWDKILPERPAPTGADTDPTIAAPHDTAGLVPSHV